MQDGTDMMIEQIKRHEGCVLHAYDDHLGYATIGYGRLIEKGMGGISESEAEILLMNDVHNFVKTAQTYEWFDGLNEPRKAVIVNMLFNLGQPRFNQFQKFQGAVETGDYTEAAHQMLSGSNGGKSKWYQQVGRRAEELAKQMETGEWQH